MCLVLKITGWARVCMVLSFWFFCDSTLGKKSNRATLKMWNLKDEVDAMRVVVVGGGGGGRGAGGARGGGPGWAGDTQGDDWTESWRRRADPWLKWTDHLQRQLNKESESLFKGPSLQRDRCSWGIGMELEKLELSQGLDQLAQDHVKVKRDSLQCFKQELS